MTQWSISLNCFDRGLLCHKPMWKVWALSQTRSRGHPPQPHAGDSPSRLGVNSPPRPRAVTRRLRWTPTSRSFHKCPTSGPSRPHASEGLSQPRASWCSTGLAGSSTHSCEDGRWMCLKGTPWCRPQGFLRGGATTDSGQSRGRDQGSEWN